MKPTSIVTLVVATLLAAGSAVWIVAGEPRNKPWPKPTPPPPASADFVISPDRVQTTEEIDRELQEHEAGMLREFERALVSRDAERREGAFAFLLPELLQVAPDRLTALMTSLSPGNARDTLRTELTRQWIATDAGRAIDWIKTLDHGERLASAKTAVAWITPHDPEAAVRLADEFGLHVRKFEPVQRSSTALSAASEKGLAR
jgi:hypothetical protein